jgi:hypothetical protein
MKPFGVVVAAMAVAMSAAVFLRPDLFKGKKGCVPVLAKCIGRGKSGDGYKTFMVSGQACADGGTSLSLPDSMDLVGDCAPVEVDKCTDPVACDGGVTIAEHECACRVDGGECTVNGRPAPYGNTLEPRTWSGAGCVRKSCVELQGESSWPEECPQ